MVYREVNILPCSALPGKNPLASMIRHHVMGMIVRVHEPWDDKLAGGVENFDPIVSRNLRCDPFDDPTVDQKIGGCRLMDVAVMVVNPSAADQVARWMDFTN